MHSFLQFSFTFSFAGFIGHDSCNAGSNRDILPFITLHFLLRTTTTTIWLCTYKPTNQPSAAAATVTQIGIISSHHLVKSELPVNPIGTLHFWITPQRFNPLTIGSSSSRIQVLVTQVRYGVCTVTEGPTSFVCSRTRSGSSGDGNGKKKQKY